MPVFDPRLLIAFAAALCWACAAYAQDPHSGERPYEMAGRQPAHPPLVNFEDLAGWTVIEHDGARGSIQTSRDEQLWGDYVAKITYSGSQAESHLEIRPPAPIPIPGEFDAAYVWTYGDNWGWMPAPNRPAIHAIIEDAAGAEHEVDFGTVDARFWFLAHARVKLLGASADRSSDIKFPARFKALRIDSIKRDEPSAIYLDNLTFYHEPLASLDVPPPGPNPFPTTPDTILPTADDNVAVSLEQRDGSWVWRCASAGGDLEYICRPKLGTLGDIEIRWGDQRFRPCADGAPVFDVGGVLMRPDDPSVQRTLVAIRRDGDAVRARWQWSKDGASAEWTLTLRAKQRSLILDITAAGGNVTEILVGRSDGTPQPKLVSVPYLTYGDRGPYVLYSDGLFLSAMFDWYNSDASELFADGAVISDTSARYTGGARYNPKTDGARNDARERIFLTVSPRFEEVLPNIPNPRSDMIDTARHHLWRNIGFTSPDMLKEYAAYGIDGFMACHHEVMWRDGGESFTQRLESAPKNVGDERLREYMAMIKSLGFLPGLYTNYRDYAPVSKQWDPDKVTRLPDGRWQRAWPRNYVFKPCFADDAEAYFAPRIHDKFGTYAGYCDVHTAVRPWDQTDYDHRVPGAGMFRPAYESYARLLYNESFAHHGPVFSEGRNHWFYAGLVDGNYAQIISPEPSREPLLVDFDLLKIHPLETDFGMGSPDMFYRDEAWREDRTFHSPHFDRFIACTIAYGHIGYLTAEWGMPGTLKSFYLLRALQELYAGVEIEQIRYHTPLSLPGRGQGEGEQAGDAPGASGGRPSRSGKGDGQKSGEMLTTSQAIASDAYLDGQVYVRYRNGLEVWVNGSWDKDWPLEMDVAQPVLSLSKEPVSRPTMVAQASSPANVPHPVTLNAAQGTSPAERQKFILPPSGFICRLPGQLFACSAITDGVRREYIECPDYVYLDTRGELLKVGPVEARGAVAVKRADEGLWLIPATECDALTVFPNDGPWGLNWPPDAVRATAYSVAGEDLGPAECRVTRGGIAVIPVEGAIKYLLHCEEQLDSETAEVEFSTQPDARAAAVGEELNAVVQVRGVSAPAHGFACKLEWVGAFGSVRALGTPEDQKPGQEAAWAFRVRVPSRANEGQRLWLRAEVSGELAGTPLSRTAWLDFIAVPALTLDVRAPEKPVAPGSETRLRIEAGTNLLHPTPLRARVTMEGTQDLALHADTTVELCRGSPALLRVGFTTPRDDVAQPFRVTLSADGRELRRDLWLKAELIQPVVYDFADHFRECVWGYRLRGADETEGAHDTGTIFSPQKIPAAGEERQGFFVHPPWKTGVGYTYAVFPVKLPRAPCRLSFGIGIRDGSTTQDGVEYRVIVLHDGREREVFRATRDRLGWEDHTVDLSPWRGETVRIKLIADVGPHDNSYSDWGAWSQPVIELAEPRVQLSVHDDRPALSYLAPPAGFAAMTEDDLRRATSATLHMQTFGVNVGEYASTMYLNGEAIGETPQTGADDWREATATLPPEALALLEPVNRFTIHNPRGDYFKIRDIWLELALPDGARAASWIATGPYSSTPEWLYSEGACAPLGSPLPDIQLRFGATQQREP